MQACAKVLGEKNGASSCSRGILGNDWQRGFTHEATPDKVCRAIVGNRVRDPRHKGRGSLSRLLTLPQKEVGRPVASQIDTEGGTLCSERCLNKAGGEGDSVDEGAIGSLHLGKFALRWGWSCSLLLLASSQGSRGGLP